MLEVKDLEVYYGMIQAIKGISFEVNQGEVIALIGANGAGKTTTLHTITGLLSPKKGSVMFEGTDMEIANLLHAGGWTTLTAVNLMLFSLLHNPCSTTIYTIYKETGSRKWTFVATVLPIVYGIIVCFLVARIWHFFA